MPVCAVANLGLIPYQQAWDLQRRIQQEVAGGERPDTLLLLEHPHVYTLGRRGRDSDILVDEARLVELGAEVHHIDRGGEVTYHGPGQLVGYPIINLLRHGGGPLKYVRTLERTLISRLESWLQGRTAVIATHRVPILALAERTLILANGRMAVDGPRDQVLDHLRTASQGGS